MADIPEYNRDKYYRIMDITQSNYANQWKRLSKDSKRADFILIYYSLAIIVYSLSVKFYPQLFDETWSSYSSLILSVIVLIYSIINSKAGYPERIAKIQIALNEVKRLKREVGALPSELPSVETRMICTENGSGGPKDSCPTPCEMEHDCSDYLSSHTNRSCLKLKSLKSEYDKLVSSTEMRDDLDFYYTILHLCKQYKLDPFNGKLAKKVESNEVDESDPIIKEIRGYISENNPKMHLFHVVFLKLCHFILYVAPVFIFLTGIIISQFSCFGNVFQCISKSK